MKKKSINNILYFLLFAILIFVDQITKVISYNKLGKTGHEKILIKNVLHLTYVENEGAAWGMMAGRQIFFIILTVIMLAVMIFVFIKSQKSCKLIGLRIVLAILAAGAVGNLIDRIMQSYVRDFIYFKCINFPVFNFADICVTVSMVILVILMLFVYKEDDLKIFRKYKEENND